MRHLLALAPLLVARPLAAQTWNDPRTLELVDRAVESRSRLLRDSTLVSYRAMGRGIVTFLAEIGPAGSPSPRLLKGDQLSVEVYWHRPDRSKQIVRAWRDSTFFPTEINYHRDHLGIVTNDFGASIRIGDGDEVVDVIHPLAPAARHHYDYAVKDSVVIRAPNGTLVLVVIDVKPKDPKTPAVVGSIYLDRDRAELVRSQLTFTKAAYRDPSLEDIAVRLDRSLVDGRYWLPFHQEIEIRRRVAMLDFPIRTVIRGRWDITDYEINPAIDPALLAGPSLGGMLQPDRKGVWDGPLIDAVDSSLAPADRSDLAALRQAALGFARSRWLTGMPSTRLRLAGVSELAHVNRVQGLAIGLGVESRAVPGFDRARASLGIGTADGRVTGAVELGRGIGSVEVVGSASRLVRDFSDLPVASGVVSSIAAQEGGHDYGDYVLVERLAAGLRVPLGSARIGVDVGRVWAGSVANEAEPARGAYRPNPELGDAARWVTAGKVEWAGQANGGSTWRTEAAGEVGWGPSAYGRVLFQAEYKRPRRSSELQARAFVGAGTDRLPAWRSFAIGGRGTLTGEIFRSYGGRSAWFASSEWLFRVPGPGFGLGRLGGLSKEAWIGPLIAAGGAGGPVSGVPWQPSLGWRPGVGIALELFGRTVRIELGQGLRGGEGPRFAVDIARQWWGVL